MQSSLREFAEGNKEVRVKRGGEGRVLAWTLQRFELIYALHCRNWRKTNRKLPLPRPEARNSSAPGSVSYEADPNISSYFQCKL